MNTIEEILTVYGMTTGIFYLIKGVGYFAGKNQDNNYLKKKFVPLPIPFDALCLLYDAYRFSKENPHKKNAKIGDMMKDRANKWI